MNVGLFIHEPETDPIEDDPDPDETPDDEQEDWAGIAQCASCKDTIAPYSIAVCAACAGQGFCTICGLSHRPTACPDVKRARLNMERAETLVGAETVRRWANDLRERWVKED